MLIVLLRIINTYFFSITSGKYHCALLTNNEKWEDAGVEAGKACGDLAFPIVFAPEFHFSEFNSEVADMKNSVSVSPHVHIIHPLVDALI